MEGIREESEGLDYNPMGFEPWFSDYGRFVMFIGPHPYILNFTLKLSKIPV